MCDPFPCGWFLGVQRPVPCNSDVEIPVSTRFVTLARANSRSRGHIPRASYMAVSEGTGAHLRDGVAMWGTFVVELP